MGFPSIADLTSGAPLYVLRWCPAGSGGFSDDWSYAFFNQDLATLQDVFSLAGAFASAGLRFQVWAFEPNLHAAWLDTDKKEVPFMFPTLVVMGLTMENFICRLYAVDNTFFVDLSLNTLDVENFCAITHSGLGVVSGLPNLVSFLRRCAPNMKIEEFRIGRF